MDDGELEFSSHEIPSISTFGDLPSSFLDEMLKDAHACTHTHTCNPPGPDNSHTHTCYHAHTKIVPASSEGEEDKGPTDDTAESTDIKSKKRSSGNREAVRKYRERKKAKTASLEDEVVKLRTVNQQLMKKLQGQAVLETEIARLKCLLVDVRGRIEGEIGSFPYQKSVNRSNESGNAYQNFANPNLFGAFPMNRCNVQCDDQLYCLRPGMEGKNVDPTSFTGQGFLGYEIDNLQCTGNQISDIPGVE